MSWALDELNMLNGKQLVFWIIMRGFTLLSLVVDQIDKTVIATGNGIAQTNDGFVIFPPSMIPCNFSFPIHNSSLHRYTYPQGNSPVPINTALSVSLPMHWG